MTRSTDNRWLHRFAVITAVATLLLLCLGGVVTSKGVGLSVPDWPTTYGYNMFFFPFSRWVGGVFYEHTHRLVASGVGFLTIILAVWLWMKESRRWLRWLGIGALVMVIAQGVLGGLRVTQLSDALGIFHATLAQLFFVLVSAIALFTSRWWLTAPQLSGADHSGLRALYLFATAVILLQLILGATMRHQHAGLAIPDFPTAYGQWWPPTDPESITRYNQLRQEVTAANPITAFQVVLQMVHRLVAVAILVSVAAAAWTTHRRLGGQTRLSRLSLGWLVLILVQVGLGAATIWTDKSADIATAHVAVGALSLVTGALLVLMAYRQFEPAPAMVAPPVPSPAGSPI